MEELTFSDGYAKAIDDVGKLLLPLVTSFDQYRESGDVLDVLRDIEGTVNEITILQRRNNL